jgi:ribosomal-protein-alanine N-acetyltransferase
MKNINLIKLDPSVQEMIDNNPQYLDALMRDDWDHVAAIVHQIVGRILDVVPAAVDELHWGGYVVIDDSTREVVGSCGFKAKPTEEGTVEIAYFTYPGFEEQGYATAMARKLIDLAIRSPEVRCVIAHTLPEQNPSTHVLSNVGMSCAGEVTDPEDGKVWRWEFRKGT